MGTIRRIYATGAVLGVAAWGAAYGVEHATAPAYEDRSALDQCALGLGQTATRSTVLPTGCPEDFEQYFAYTKTATTTYSPQANSHNTTGHSTDQYQTKDVTITYTLPTEHSFLKSLSTQADKWSSNNDLLANKNWVWGATASLAGLFLASRPRTGSRKRKHEEEHDAEGSEV